jgi:aspartyl-tRNA(Asn)/glutamyl-tRNA(Gln) amidotransferase subunit A
VNPVADDLFHQTVGELSARLARKELSSVELTQAVIARTHAVEGRVQAFNSFDEADALAQAEASDARRAAGRAKGSAGRHPGWIEGRDRG